MKKKNSMKKKNKKASDIVLTIFIVLIVAGFVIALLNQFWKLVSTDKNSSESGKKTEIQQLIEKDLDKAYPETPREVVKTYCKITKALYYGEATEEEIPKLNEQMRKLFDEVLLAGNDYDQALEALRTDLSDYSKDKKKVVNYAIQDVDDVKTYLYEGRENAKILVSFSIKENNEWKKANEEFVVRKDEEGRWKILGWQTADTVVSNDEEE